MNNLTQEKKYCAYIKDGKSISEIMECSEKDNIAVSGITIIRSANITGLKEMIKKLVAPQKKLTPEVISKIRGLIVDEEFLMAKQLFLEYTGKDMCCIGKIEAYLNGFK